MDKKKYIIEDGDSRCNQSKTIVNYVTKERDRGDSGTIKNLSKVKSNEMKFKKVEITKELTNEKSKLKSSNVKIIKDGTNDKDRRSRSRNSKMNQETTTRSNEVINRKPYENVHNVTKRILRINLIHGPDKGKSRQIEEDTQYLDGPRSRKIEEDTKCNKSDKILKDKKVQEKKTVEKKPLVLISELISEVTKEIAKEEKLLKKTNESKIDRHTDENAEKKQFNSNIRKPNINLQRNIPKSRDNERKDEKDDSQTKKIINQRNVTKIRDVKLGNDKKSDTIVNSVRIPNVEIKELDKTINNLRERIRGKITEMNKNDRAKKPWMRSDETLQSIIEQEVEYSDHYPIPPVPTSSYKKLPIIRTVTSKHERSKTYKQVSFETPKIIRPLNVIIPTSKSKSKTEQKSVDTVNRACITDKTNKIKRDVYRNRKECVKSKMSPKINRIKSPITEVAKWAPECIDDHTKQYYEAWVDTTLAAISKGSRKDKLFIKQQKLLESYQKALSESPAELTDEKYTGRIKVTQRYFSLFYFKIRVKSTIN